MANLLRDVDWFLPRMRLRRIAADFSPLNDLLNNPVAKATVAGEYCCRGYRHFRCL